MNARNIKRSLMLSLLSMILCVSMLVGTTFAWFTDSVTSANNTIMSGNLDIELEYSTDMVNWTVVDASTNVFDDAALWEPGYTEVVYLRVSNVGSLALKYQLGINVASETEGVNVLGDSFKLSDYIMYGVNENITEKYADRATAVAATTNATKLNSTYAKGFELNAKTETTTDNDVFALVLYMPESVGNEANHNGVNAPSINLGLTVLATQLSAESDSFGPDYDLEAVYPSASSVNRTDDTREDVLNAGDVAIVLVDGTEEGLYELKVPTKNISTDDNGNTTVNYDINLYKDGVKVENDGTTEYTISIKVGTGLNISEVLHRDAPVTDFTYNPLEEYVTFKTYDFSPFSVTYTKYEEGTVFVSTAAELQSAIKKLNDGYDKENGITLEANIVLVDDITFDSTSEFMYTEKLNGCHLYLYHANVNLDLNGHNIVATSDALMSGKSTATALFLVRYAELNIKGEGNVIAQNQAIAVYGWAHSTINIYGGNYVSNCAKRTEGVIYVNNTSVTINVYGGTYTGSDFGFNTHNTSCEGAVIILHEGIEFYDYKNHFLADYNGGRIALAEGCTYVTEEIDGKLLYKIVAEDANA